MSARGLDVFDKTVQTTNAWLKGIMEVTGPDRRRAYRALAAVLHALRDRSFCSSCKSACPLSR